MAESPAGAQRPYRRALFAAIIVAILLIGLLSAVLAVHHGPQRPTAEASALRAKTNQASGQDPPAKPSPLAVALGIRWPTCTTRTRLYSSRS